MPRVEPETGKIKWYKSDGAKSIYASLISILIGMAVGTLIILIVGLTKDNISVWHPSGIPGRVQYRT